MKHKVELHFEPSDCSVGIMSEGFAGWEDDGTLWCNLVEYGNTFESSKFEWFDESIKGPNDRVDAPPNHKFIERIIWAFANSYYDSMNEAYEDIEQEDDDVDYDNLFGNKSGLP